MNITELATLSADTIGKVCGNDIDTLDAWCKLGEAFQGVTRGNVTKVADRVYRDFPTFTMAERSFVARVLEAQRLVKACGGTATATDAAIDKLNDERIGKGQRPLYSVQTLYKVVCKPTTAKKAPKTGKGSVTSQVGALVSECDDIAALEAIVIAAQVRIAALRPTVVADAA